MGFREENNIKANKRRHLRSRTCGTLDLAGWLFERMSWFICRSRRSIDSATLYQHHIVSCNHVSPPHGRPFHGLQTNTDCTQFPKGFNLE